MALGEEEIQRLAQSRAKTEQDKASLLRQIQGMAMGERVKLASIGNMEIRSLLLSDPLGEVQAAVLRNPEITEMEILSIASSRAASDEVLRLIVNNPQWVKSDAVKLALVKNHRTPLKLSLRLLTQLSDEELKGLIRSDRVPSAVVAGVKRILAAREGPRLSERADPSIAHAPVRDDGALHKLAEAQPVTEQDRTNLFLQIQRMGVGERTRLAMLGNREIRTVLIRDSNRAVQVAVMNNPRITESEIERIASSKTVDEEVIRLIINHREWTKNYAIKLALVRNPKVPIRASLKFLTHLRDKDLREIARSRDISNVVVVGAKHILTRRLR